MAPAWTQVVRSPTPLVSRETEVQIDSCERRHRMRITHPKGLTPPWAQGSRITADQLKEWLEHDGPGATPVEARKWKGKGGRRTRSLGHSCRSAMEANWVRYLRYLGYQPWTHKEQDPPAGAKWYRYERRRWEFPDLRGATSFYVADVEVWPGLIDPTRPYEVHEIKGYLDRASKTKVNRMAKYFSAVPLELITTDRFKQLTAGAPALVPNWE